MAEFNENKGRLELDGLMPASAKKWGECAGMDAFEAAELNAEDRQELARALAVVLDWLWEPALREGAAAKRMEMVGRRVGAALWVIGSEQFEGDPSCARLAKSLGCHKAVLSELTSDFSKVFGIRNGHQGHGWNWRAEKGQDEGKQK